MKNLRTIIFLWSLFLAFVPLKSQSDILCNYTSISAGTTGCSPISGSTVGFTNDTSFEGSCLGTESQDGFYWIIGIADGATYTVEVAGTNGSDVVLGIVGVNGVTCATSIEIGCVDNSASSPEVLTFTASNFDYYFVHIYEYYGGTATFDICIYEFIEVEGCTESNADNYNPNATQDDGSCTFGACFPEFTATLNGANTTFCQGETNNLVFNIEGDEGALTTYIITSLSGLIKVLSNSPANEINISNLAQDTYEIWFVTISGPGTLSFPTNYIQDMQGCYTLSNSTNIRIGQVGSFCDDGNSITINDMLNDDCDCEGIIQETYGCLDPLASNYYPFANYENGNCVYDIDCTDTLVISDFPTTISCDSPWMQDGLTFEVSQGAEFCPACFTTISNDFGPESIFIGGHLEVGLSTLDDVFQINFEVFEGCPTCTGFYLYSNTTIIDSFVNIDYDSPYNYEVSFFNPNNLPLTKIAFESCEASVTNIEILYECYDLDTLSSSQPNWNPVVPTNASGFFRGQAQIDSFPAETGDWIAAIDPNGVIAGAAPLTINTGIAYINFPIYGDDLSTSTDEGLSLGEYFTLQLFDVSSGIYMDYTLNGQIVQFTEWQNANGGTIPAYSDPNTIYNFISNPLCTDIISLNPGWNLISLDVSPSDKSIGTVFGGISNNNLEFVTGFDNGALIYNPDAPPFLNTLTQIQDGFGYWVKVQNSDVLTVTGECLSESYRKPLDAGWNLVAYPPALPMSPDVYLSDLISNNNLEFVTGFENGALIYNPNDPPFLNTLTQMKNGLGYWVKVQNATNGLN